MQTNSPSLRCTGYRQCENTVGIPVAVTRVRVPTAVAGSPYKYGSFSMTALQQKWKQTNNQNSFLQIFNIILKKKPIPFYEFSRVFEPRASPPCHPYDLSLKFTFWKRELYNRADFSLNAGKTLDIWQHKIEINVTKMIIDIHSTCSARFTKVNMNSSWWF